MHPQLKGKVWILGDNINTDDIAPVSACFITDPKERRKHCLKFICPSFGLEAEEGDIIVAGSNFGCGSSREYAPDFLILNGIRVIIAQSFARIFYRNAFNKGMLLITNSQLKQYCKTGDMISVILNESVTLSDGTVIPLTERIPENLLALYEAGGLIEYHRKRNRSLKEKEGMQ